MTEAKCLLNNELKDQMQNQGILQEMNRTMLHPIGLELRLNDENNLEIWKTDDPKGFVFDRINKMYQQVFKSMNIEKQQKRQDLLGFGIQVHDLYRSSKLENLGRLAIPPQKVKIKLIVKCLDTFIHIVYQKILLNHKNKDNNFDIDQFDYPILMERILNNINKKDWVDVATYAMMLHQKETLKNGMQNVQRAAIDCEDLNKEKNTND